jgi:hypothetical protein
VLAVSPALPLVFTRSFWELWKEFGIADAISLLEIGERPHMKDGVCACFINHTSQQKPLQSVLTLVRWE